MFRSARAAEALQNVNHKVIRSPTIALEPVGVASCVHNVAQDLFHHRLRLLARGDQHRHFLCTYVHQNGNICMLMRIVIKSTGIVS